jgi:hypothetical protein
MKKKIVLKEGEFIKLIESIVKEHKKSLNEQGSLAQFTLRRFIGNSVDDLSRMFGDDALKRMESAVGMGIGNKANFVMKNGKAFILSKSGTEVPLETINAALKAVADGKYKMDDIVQYLPRQLADGTEFRSVFANIKPKPQVQAAAGSAAKSALSAFEQKHLLKDCFSNSYCNTKVIFSNFLGKLSNTARIFAFNPSKVRVNERAVVAGREILDVTLEDGTRVLFYKSSGANVGTTGKQAGEWFVIPGFAENGWFFKTHETIALTKGNNKYLTEFAEYLQTKGPGMLGR